MKKIYFLPAIFTILSIFLFSCERTETFIPPANNTKYDCERKVCPYYFINKLEKTIKIEIHRDSMNVINELYNKEEIFWKVDRATLKFKIEPNDTVCFDSVVWCACEGIYDYISPTAVAFHDLIDTYYFMKITYNKKQYKYTDNKLIHNFFRLNNEHPAYVRINEEKKNTFGWE